MSEEKKRIERLIPPKPEPKKRETIISQIKPEIKVEEMVNAELLVAEKKRIRAKSSDDKYIRFSSKEYKDNFSIISERVLKGEIQLAYSAIDEPDYYFYYLVINKQTNK